MSESPIIAQLLINGILFGTMYGVAAIGLSLIYGTMRIIFFAQGTTIIFFSYVCYWLFTLLGIDPYLSLIIIFPASLLLGMGFYNGLFKEAAGLEVKEVGLLIAIGLVWLMENSMLVFWTADPRTVVTAYTSSVLTLFGVTISSTRLITLLIAILSAVGVSFFLKKSIIGIAVRAASEDMESTTLMGINPHRVNTIAFALGVGLAGIAGVCLATVYSFDPMYGFTFVIMSVIALALGGMGSVYGALLGGIILGLIQSLGAYFVGTVWADPICFGVFLLFLIFRPQGIFGRST